MAGSSDDVRRLVAGGLGGDEGAIRHLVDRFRDRVFGLCYRMLRHRQDAEDATQESFVRAVRSLRRWDSSRDFAPWLLAIAANRCRTLLSLRARRRTVDCDVATLPDARPAEPEMRRLAEEVLASLGTLREEHRRAFVMFHVEQHSYAEIARHCGVPLGTVKTWVHRARRTLAEQLQQREQVTESCDAV